MRPPFYASGTGITGKNYRQPGYAQRRGAFTIEKRGMYYLARRLGSQLNLATEKTDYKRLEKCYSVWICRDRIPKEERFSISFCRMHNHKNIGKTHMRKEDYDLMEPVVVRLGSSDCPADKQELFPFLTALFYPHRADFRETVGRYIDLETNGKLKEEVTQMTGLGMSILQEGWKKGQIAGRSEGKAEGKAEDILDLLSETGAVSAELTGRIYAQGDEGVLRRWLKLAAKADSVEQFVKEM